MKAAQTSAWGGWHEVVLLLLLITLLAVGGAVMPSFLSLQSQLFLSRHLWETALLALGMTLVIIAGGIDLSVGSAMALCAVMFGMCHQATGSIALSSLACLATGVACGSLNGLLVAGAGVHPLIVTLATYAAFRGTAEGISQGDTYSDFGLAFSQIARGDVAGIPYPAFLFALLAIAHAVFLSCTPWGRFVYAVGHNEQAVRFSGVRVDGLKFWLHAHLGALAGLATIVYVSRFNTAKADAGTGLELDAITAVVIGGTSIFGGRGTIFGTAVGLLLIHETRQFVGRYWRIDELKSILIGLLLILSILVYRAFTPGEKD